MLQYHNVIYIKALNQCTFSSRLATDRLCQEGVANDPLKRLGTHEKSMMR